MEIFTMLLGLFMIYAWMHATIIVSRIMKDAVVSKYEKSIVIAGFVFIILYILGTI